MRQTTTPTVRIRTNIPNLEIYDQIRVAVYCGRIEANPIIREKEGLVIEGSTIMLTLTQDETNLLSGKCTVEMRVEMAGNVIRTSDAEFYVPGSVDRVKI